jgi:hypothetical protein
MLHQTMNISKVPTQIWETVLAERIKEATTTQLQVEAIENDGKPQGTPEKRRAVHDVLKTSSPDFEHMMELVHTNGAIQKSLHSAAHELLNACSEWGDDGHKPCIAVIQAECQMIILGFKLAVALLECKALENIT